MVVFASQSLPCLVAAKTIHQSGRAILGAGSDGSRGFPPGELKYVHMLQAWAGDYKGSVLLNQRCGVTTGKFQLFLSLV